MKVRQTDKKVRIYLCQDVCSDTCAQSKRSDTGAYIERMTDIRIHNPTKCHLQARIQQTKPILSIHELRMERYRQPRLKCNLAWEDVLVKLSFYLLNENRRDWPGAPIQP